MVVRCSCCVTLTPDAYVPRLFFLAGVPAAVGKPLPTFQWFKRGKVMPRETKPELTLAHVTEAECDMYFCEITNARGSVRTSTAEISLEASAPHVFTYPVSQTVGVGGDVRFTIEAFGVPQPTFQWSHNGAAIAGATLNELRIAAVDERHYGEYECTVTNSLGSVVSPPAMLRRQPTAPVITKLPAAAEVIRGEDAALTVEGACTRFLPQECI